MLPALSQQQEVSHMHNITVYITLCFLCRVHMLV